MKKKIKDGSLYFRQRDVARPLGGGMMVVGLVLFYFGWSLFSYIIASLFTPVGLVLFIVGGLHLVTDHDMDEQLDRALHGYDRSVTEMQGYNRVVLRSPAPVETSAYGFGEDATYFKRAKGGTPRSDRYTRAHFFYTAEALIVVGRTISIAAWSEEGAGVTDFTETLAYADVTARIEEHSTPVTMTTGGKSTTVKWCELIITDKVSGEVRLRLPVPNDVEVEGICAFLARRAS